MSVSGQVNNICSLELPIRLTCPGIALPDCAGQNGRRSGCNSYTVSSICVLAGGRPVVSEFRGRAGDHPGQICSSGWRTAVGSPLRRRRDRLRRAAAHVCPGCCEVKRLYVSPEGRGLGLGGKLVEAVVREAVRIGYREMMLDTLPSMAEAIALYRKSGFEPTEPYYDSPVIGTIFMRRSLLAM